MYASSSLLSLSLSLLLSLLLLAWFVCAASVGSGTTSALTTGGSVAAAEALAASC